MRRVLHHTEAGCFDQQGVNHESSLVCCRNLPSHSRSATLLDARGRSRPDLFTDAQRKAVQRPYDDAIDEAEAFLGSIDSLSHIDALIDAATRRRNAALQDIERYQSRFAEKLRVVSGAVIDGNVAPKKSES